MAFKSRICKTSRSHCKSFSSVDLFGDRFSMHLDKGQSELKSILGAFFSMFVIVVMLLYTNLKLDVLINKKDIDVLSVVQENFFSPTDNFTYTDGFNIAVGFSDYEKSDNLILDPTYGDLLISS